MSNDSRESGKLHNVLTSRFTAVGVMFFLNGMLLGVWVPHIPEVQQRLALGEGALGVALLMLPLGSFAIMPVGAWIIRTFGSRRATVAGFVTFSAGLTAVLLAPVYALLAGGLALFGAGNGLMDVGMNAQGVDVEHSRPRPIMSSLHGLYSVGNFTGALLAGGLLSLGLAPEVNGLLAAAGGLIVGVPFTRRLAARDRSAVKSGEEEGPGIFVRHVSGFIVLLSVLAFLNLLGESSMNDWSTVYMRGVLETQAGVAALAYGAFAFAMAVGRFSGDRVIAFVGRRVVLGAGFTLAALGIGTSMMAGTALPAIAGFALAGLGLANGIPILFGAAGRVRGLREGSGMAVVMGMAYAGGLVSPPTIGFVAEAIGLQWTLLGVAAVLLGGGVTSTLIKVQ